jgi:hypothetical protein
MKNGCRIIALASLPADGHLVRGGGGAGNLHSPEYPVV